MIGYSDGPNSRPTSTVWNAKCFVQIQMANVGTDLTRFAETDECVHVGPVHVDLTATTMNHRADLWKILFKNSVGRGIRHHQGPERFGMGRNLMA